MLRASVRDGQRRRSDDAFGYAAPFGDGAIQVGDGAREGVHVVSSAVGAVGLAVVARLELAQNLGGGGALGAKNGETVDHVPTLSPGVCT